MKKSMTLSYEVDGGLYLNITNKCPCNCTFCIRNNGDGAYGSDPLWLEHQPSAEEIIEDLKKRELDSYKQIVFCGYGEPTCELELLKTVSAYLRSVTKTPIRINTNGLSDLINKRNTAPEFKGVDSFEAMLRFAENVKAYVPDVVLTVVDIIGEEEIERSRRIAESIGVRLRVREYIPE